MCSAHVPAYADCDRACLSDQKETEPWCRNSKQGSILWFFFCAHACTGGSCGSGSLQEQRSRPMKSAPPPSGVQMDACSGLSTCRGVVHRCRPAAGGNVAASVPPRASAQPGGSLCPGMHPILPGPHLSGQPSQPAAPLLGPGGSLPVLGQVLALLSVL